MTTPHRISVAVPRPLAGCFDYLCAEPVAVGARVRVPFGRDRVIGVVLAVAAMDDSDGLKAVEAVLDSAPLLDAAQLALLRFAARYYQHPIGEVVQAALPVPLREGRPVLRQLPRRWRLTEAGVAAQARRLGAKQAAALAFLAEHGEADEAALREACAASPAWLMDLQRRGWLACHESWRGVTAEAVAAPTLNDAQAAALAALERVGLAHRSDHLPKQLSGGEQQRVCIARALINEPEILFADEPTGNLDAENEQTVLRIFAELHAQKRTIVMVTHNPDLGAKTDRIIRLQHGKIQE